MCVIYIDRNCYVIGTREYKKKKEGINGHGHVTDETGNVTSCKQAEVGLAYQKIINNVKIFLLLSNSCWSSNIILERGVEFGWSKS